MSGNIISLPHQRPGVGSTPTPVNLAPALAACAMRVLLIDFDPQGNASTGLGIDPDERDLNSYRLVTGETGAESAIVGTQVPGLSLIPATMDLSAAEVELSPLDRREYRLSDKIAEVKSRFDYILIDCPPSLGLLTVNALCSAHAVIVPLQCEFYALEGLAQLSQTISTVQAGLNPDLVLQGIVLTMYDTRNKLSEMVESDVRAHFGATVYQTVIPRNVRISEAPSFGQPILMYDLKCAGAQAYAALAAELLKQEQKVA